MISKIDHIGIAVNSLAEAIEFYEQALGLSSSGRIEEVLSQQVRTVFFQVGEVKIELLEPTGPESPVAHFLKKRGPGIHHIAFATTGINEQLKQAHEAGARLIHEVPFEGAGDKLVAFLHPKSTFGVLMELCQPKE